MYNSRYGQRGGFVRAARPPEDNLQTLRLDKLLELLNCKLLRYYLEQIAIFLRNNKKDLWFPKINPDLDAFLVRCIRDEQNIRALLDKFDSACRIPAEQIIESMKKNKGVFSLAYTYNCSRIDNNTLVYKKVFVAKTSEAALVNQFVESHHSNDDSQSIEPPEQNQGIELDKQIKWLKDMLSFAKDTTLWVMDYPEMTFIQANFVYSSIRQRNNEEHTDSQVRSLFQAIKNATNKLSMSNISMKSSFLYVANNIVRLTVEKVSISNNNNNVVKKPLAKKSNAIKKQDPNRSQTSETLSESRQMPAEKTYERRKQLIESLERSFIKATLKMILNFIITEAEASIVFSNANEEQCLFIQSACAIAKYPKWFDLFSEDSREVLRSINKALCANDWYKVNVEVAKVQKDCKLRKVSLIKVLKEKSYDKGSLSRDRSQVEPRPGCSSQPVNESVSTDRNRKNPPKNNVAFQSGGTLAAEKGGIRFLDDRTETSQTKDKVECKPKEEQKAQTRLSRIDHQKPSCSHADQSETERAQSETKHAQNETKLAQSKTKQAQSETKQALNKTKQAQSETKQAQSETKQAQSETKQAQSETKQVQSETKQVQSETKQAQSETKQPKSEVIDKAVDLTKQSDGRNLCMRKVKLLEAMAVPIESEIASRMMRQMGWEGGPLGARGDGIAEPIVPALHIASGAGLGHIRPDTKRDTARKTTAGFRLDFLQQLLGIVIEDRAKLVVEYSKSLTKKEKSFVKKVTIGLSKKGNVQVEDDACKKVVGFIADKLVSKPNYVLMCDFSKDSRFLTLTMEDPTKDNEPKEAPVFIDKNNVKMQKLLETPEVIDLNFTREVAEHYYPIRMSRFPNTARNVGYRIVVLYKILECLKNDGTNMTVTFGYSLTPKQCNFVKDAVLRVNHRAISSHNDGIEGELGAKTLKCVKQDSLNVSFEGRSFKLKKTNAVSDARAKELFDLANNNKDIADRNQLKDTKHTNKYLKLAINKSTKSTDVCNESKNITKATTINPKIEKNDSTTKNANIDKSNNGIKDANNMSGTKPVTDNIKVEANTIVENDKSKEKPITKDETIQSETVEVKAENHIETNVDESGGKQNVKTLNNDVKDKKESVCDCDTTDRPSSIDLSFERQETVEVEYEFISSITTKRLRSDSDNSGKIMKKTKPNITSVHISPKDGEKITNEIVRKFQLALTEKIDLGAQLPLLECHGIENGVLIYSCHNEVATTLVYSVASDMNLKTTDVSEEFKKQSRYKLKMKLNSYVGVNMKKLFSTIESYNSGLVTENWSVVDVEIFKGYIVIVVEVDKQSFQYVKEAKFMLFAGMDKLQFSTAWD